MALSNLHTVVGGYNLLWEDIEVKANVRNVTEDGRGFRAELEIVSRNPGVSPLLYHNQVSLLSVNSKSQLCRELEKRLSLEEIPGRAPWHERIEYLCHAIVANHRQGQPVQEVGNEALRTSQAYRLKPILPEMVPTVLFGDGGSGKSYLALAMALLVQTGKTKLGMQPQEGNVLYLDYETSHADVNERIRALSAGLELGENTIQYRRCEMPLVREVGRIAKLVSEHEIALAIVDSVGMALDGSANKDELVNSLFVSLRQLRTTTLLVDHIAKNAEGTGTPFGSAYKSNSARSVWRVRGEAEAKKAELSVGLWHTKVNEGKTWDAMGFRFRFDNNEHNRVLRAGVVREDARDAFPDDISRADKVLKVLEGGQMEAGDIADETGLPKKTVQVVLSQLKGKGKVTNLARGMWGLAIEF